MPAGRNAGPPGEPSWYHSRVPSQVDPTVNERPKLLAILKEMVAPPHSPVRERLGRDRADGPVAQRHLVLGVRPPYRLNLFLESMEFVGVQSVFIVGLTGLFIGMVFGIQLVDGFRDFGAENQTGAVVGMALARELSPVFTALMVSSRAGRRDEHGAGLDARVGPDRCA